MTLTYNWQQHLERCARLGISTHVMTEAEWLREQDYKNPRTPRMLSESEKEKLESEAHDVGRSISGMQLQKETVETFKNGGLGAFPEDDPRPGAFHKP